MTLIDDTFLDEIEEDYGGIAKSLSLCLRPTFTSEHPDQTMIWGDWSNIEARILPWLTNSEGGQDILDVFKSVDEDPSNPDIYMIQAAKIHGINPNEIVGRLAELKANPNSATAQAGAKEAKGWRQEGKVAVLALGYGGSVGALKMMATIYGLHIDEERAAEIVGIWREANKWAVDFWTALKAAFSQAWDNPGTVYEAGRCAFVFDRSYLQGTMFCVLPCGRPLCYPNLRHGTFEEVDADGVVYEKKALMFRSGYKRHKKLWHGIMAGNPTQGFAGSILRAKLARIDADGVQARADGYYPLIDVRGHTHDEIICEAHKDDLDAARKYLKSVMVEPEPWSEGLPLAAEITDHWHYTKAFD